MTGPVIALVDDDVAILTALSSLLRSEGFAVQVHNSAAAFLDALATAPPQCLITDIQMPGVDGLELLQVSRAECPSLPIIVMTAFPDPFIREQALAGGALCFLSKPFDAEELLGWVRRTVDY